MSKEYFCGFIAARRNKNALLLKKAEQGVFIYDSF